MKHKLPSVYFLHIAKTAGTSLAPIIRCAYPQEKVMPVYQIPDLLKLNREDINKYECFTGHFGTGLFSLLDRDIPSVTMLRDPFERTISLIRYARRRIAFSEIEIPELSNDLKQLIIKGDFREIINDPFLSKTIENNQTLSLGCDFNLNKSLDSSDFMLDQSNQFPSRLGIFFAQQLQDGLDMNKVVDNAKKRLDKMEVVGIVEHFNDSTRLICDFLGIKAPNTFPKENVSPEKLSLKTLTYRESGEIPEDVIKRIDELTVCDQEIYEYGKTLFARQLRNKKKKFFGFFNEIKY